MKEYFISIIAIALVGSLIISMLPSSSNAKYLRLICGLCAIGCIVFPLINADEMMIDFESLKKLGGGQHHNSAPVFTLQILSADKISGQQFFTIAAVDSKRTAFIKAGRNIDAVIAMLKF